jgi:hypothetical protein
LLGAVLLADMPEFATEIEAAEEEYDPWETVGEAAAWAAAAGAAAAWAAVGAAGAAEEAAGASEEVDGAVVEALDCGAASAAADEAEEAEKPADAESQVH